MSKFYPRSRVSFQPFGICTIEGEGDPGPNGGGAGVGDGGGGGGSEPAAPAASSDGGRQHTPVDYNWDTSTRPQPTTAQVASVLAKESDKNHTIGESEIAALLNWNPSLKSPKTSESQLAAPSPAQQPTPDPAAPPAATPPAPVLDPNVQAIVQALKTVTDTPAPGVPAQPNQPTQPKVFYGGHRPAIQVPESLVADLFDPNDAQKNVGAINTMLNGLANMVIQDVSQLMLSMRNDFVSQVPTLTQQQIAAQSNSEKFYSRYPELNKPALKSAVEVIAAKTLQAHQGPVTEAVLDQIGNEVHKFVEAQFGFKLSRAQNTAAAPAPTAKPNRKPVFQTPGNGRPPASNPATGGQSADILSNLI